MTVKPIIHIFSRLAIFACTLACSGPVLPQATDARLKEIDPPKCLVDAGLVHLEDRLNQESRERRAMHLTQVYLQAKPTDWPKLNVEVHGPLPTQASDRLEQGQFALSNGRPFEAVQVFSEALEFAPDHPEVKRALGIAYAKTGNLSRAVTYLREAVVQNPEDPEALIILARHSSANLSLEQTLSYCDALDEIKWTKPLADYFRFYSLSRHGYTVAAAEQLADIILRLKDTGPKLPDKHRERPVQVMKELRVLHALEPQMQMQQGDLYFLSGDLKRAEEAYARVSFTDPSNLYAIANRQVYLALRAGETQRAIDLLTALLSRQDATDRDAALLDYLVDQGVSPQVLADRLDAMITNKGVTLSRLVALSRVTRDDRLLSHISVWMDGKGATPEYLEKIVALVDFNDDNPSDARYLAKLLHLVARQMQNQPEMAMSYARAAIDPIDAPVTLLRAILTANDPSLMNNNLRLLFAVGYEKAGRIEDALDAYSAINSSELAQQVRLDIVRLRLSLGQGRQAYELIGEPLPGADWPAFEWSLRAMGATGQARDAVIRIDQWIKDNGKQLAYEKLRIELIAQMGQPQEACNLLLRLISSYPSEESLYRLGIDLAYNYQDGFDRAMDAERMRRAFLSRLISNLPESPLARLSMAHNLVGNPARLDEAEQLLLKALGDDPQHVGVLSLLVEIYDKQDEPEKADVFHARYIRAIGPGMDQALIAADRALSQGKPDEVVKILQNVLELEKLDILPGPAMTAEQANALLHYLGAAQPQVENEALYLAMLRRFPDHPQLNNGLGYRWAVQGKNLLQAKTMIERALKADPINYSLLDSLAWTYYKLGQFEQALVTQDRALKTLEQQTRLRGLEHDSGATIAILNDHMGDIHYKLGNARQALEHWRIAGNQTLTDKQMQMDQELTTLRDRLEAKVNALADGKPAPVSPVPGPEAHGVERHPAEQLAP